MKKTKAKINDTELEAVTGGGEYIAFVDSDDYKEIETYETAYKHGEEAGFAGREISPLN